MSKLRSFIFILCCFPAFVLAESESTISTPIAPAPVKRRALPLNIFADAWPVPLLQGGAGFALELNVFNRWSLWFALEREVHDPGAWLNILGAQDNVTYDNRFIGIRHYFKNIERSNWFAGAGAKYSHIQVMHSPGIFRGPSASSDEVRWGPYVSAGYRFLLNSSRTFTWLFDVGLNFEHGIVKETNYRETSYVDASVSPEYEYGLRPEARLGVHF